MPFTTPLTPDMGVLAVDLSSTAPPVVPDNSGNVPPIKPT